MNCSECGQSLYIRDGQFCWNDRSIPVSSTEGRLIEKLLLGNPWTFATSDALRAVTGGHPGGNTIQVHLGRLRDRLVHLGLRVRCIRKVGYVLEQI